MPDQVDEQSQDPATPEQGRGAGSGESPAPSAPVRFKHTRWQRFVRDVYQLYGPAQTGLPPYATPEERESWRLATVPETPETTRPSTAPPGYRMVQYRDSQGYLHRSLVPDTEPPATTHSASSRS